MKVKCTLIFFIFYFSTFACTIKSIRIGKWSDSTTWDLNRIPFATDTVVLEHFIHFDQDFENISPSYLHITDCGALCGQHTYTGRYIIYGIVNIKRFNLIYGSSNSYPNENWTTQINVSEGITISGAGTSMHNNLVGICVGQNCVSSCEGNEIFNRGNDCILNIDVKKEYPNNLKLKNPITYNELLTQVEFEEFELFDFQGKFVCNRNDILKTTLNQGLYFIHFKRNKQLYFQKLMLL